MSFETANGNSHETVGSVYQASNEAVLTQKQAMSDQLEARVTEIDTSMEQNDWPADNPCCGRATGLLKWPL
eukprot:4699363-Pyramimonas_sp.AAC.1